MTYAWLFTDKLSSDDASLVPAESLGLEAFRGVIDALNYARGPFLHRVKMNGLIANNNARLLAYQRTTIWSSDVTDILRACARHWAGDVAGLWNAPPVVCEYLKTGHEELRAAAEKIAGDAHNSAQLRLYGPNKHKASEAEIAADHAVNAAWAAIAYAPVADYAAHVAATNAAFAKACVISHDGCWSRCWRESRKFVCEQQEKHIVDMVLNLRFSEEFS